MSFHIQLIFKVLCGREINALEGEKSEGIKESKLIFLGLSPEQGGGQESIWTKMQIQVNLETKKRPP